MRRVSDTAAGAPAATLDGMDGFTRFEREGWEDRAAGYGGLLLGITDRVVDDLLDAAAVTVGTRLLDAACGYGGAAARAAGRGAAAVGVDVSAAMLALARARHPGLAFRAGRVESLPFDAAAVDAVVASFLLPHLADPHAAVAEFARVTVPGGRLALTVWDLPERARFIGVLVDAIAAGGPLATTDLPAGPPFFRYADDAAMRELLRSAGYRDVAVTTVAFTHHVATTDEWWHGLLDGTVRTSALVLTQPPEVQRRIRAAFERLAAAHAGGTGSGLALPVSVKLASATR